MAIDSISTAVLTTIPENLPTTRREAIAFRERCEIDGCENPGRIVIKDRALQIWFCCYRHLAAWALRMAAAQGEAADPMTIQKDE
jgi:hypothetical protein